MRVLVTGLCAGLATLALVARPGAQPPPDFAQAKVLYDSATTALNDGRYEDAIRDFGAAYDITKDPVLFFKIATANEKAGKCGTALVYYGRYLREAKPEPKFVELTNERIVACGGDATMVGDVGSGSGIGSGSAVGSGAAESGSGSGSGAEIGAGSAVALGSGAAEKPAHGDAPWLMVGGALAFVTVGAVLAYSASSSEQDIRDLYVGFDGNPPQYDDKIAQRYHDLVDEGHRYQYLSWGAFGIAAGFGVAAAILFVRDHDEQRVTVTPTASPSSAGVSATVRF
jgi:hypothetical protein